MTPPYPRPWLAAVLSLFFSPLGFLYAGRPALALLFFVLPLGCRILAFFTSGAITPAASIAEIALWVAGVVLAWWLAKSAAGRERLDETAYDVLVQRQGLARLEEPMHFPLRERCTVSPIEMRCAVPAGHLFVLGDHRDFSQDSRYFGFVRADQVIGRVAGIYPAER